MCTKVHDDWAPPTVQNQRPISTVRTHGPTSRAQNKQTLLNMSAIGR